MEEFNLDLDLDDAAKARIAHAEFLESVKDWATHAAMVVAPFSKVASDMTSGELDMDIIKGILMQLPFGIALLINEFNTFYDLLQNEAVKVLGSAFPMHKEHSKNCGEEDGVCGHQDHYNTNTD